jgi:hypothetical protein
MDTVCGVWTTCEREASSWVRDGGARSLVRTSESSAPHPMARKCRHQSSSRDHRRHMRCTKTNRILPNRARFEDQCRHQSNTQTTTPCPKRTRRARAPRTDVGPGGVRASGRRRGRSLHASRGRVGARSVAHQRRPPFSTASGASGDPSSPSKALNLRRITRSERRIRPTTSRTGGPPTVPPAPPPPPPPPRPHTQHKTPPPPPAAQPPGGERGGGAGGGCGARGPGGGT